MCLHRQFRALPVQMQIRKSARRVALCGTGASGWRRRDPSSQMADGLRTRERLLLARCAFINKFPCADGSQQLARWHGSPVSHSFAGQLAGWLCSVGEHRISRLRERRDAYILLLQPAGRDRIWVRAADERHLDAFGGHGCDASGHLICLETPVARSRRESSVLRPSGRCSGIAAQRSPVAPDWQHFDQNLVRQARRQAVGGSDNRRAMCEGNRSPHNPMILVTPAVSRRKTSCRWMPSSFHHVCR